VNQIDKRITKYLRFFFQYSCAKFLLIVVLLLLLLI
jgi:hypothetical protein